MSQRKAPYGGDSLCRVIYADGSPCGKKIRWGGDLCPACSTWKSRNRGKDPDGRKPVHKLTPEQVAARIRAIPVTPEGCRIGSELYATDKDGYPLLKSGGVMWRASRFVLTQKLGRPIAPGMQACHTCDNPACISEEHLWEGSHEDNQKDASSKGRKPVGHGHSRPLRKLNEQQVREIRDLYSAGGTSHSKLSAQYGVSPGAIEKVVTRRSWKWLD